LYKHTVRHHKHEYAGKEEDQPFPSEELAEENELLTAQNDCDADGDDSDGFNNTLSDVVDDGDYSSDNNEDVVDDGVFDNIEEVGIICINISIKCLKV